MANQMSTVADQKRFRGLFINLCLALSLLLSTVALPFSSARAQTAMSDQQIKLSGPRKQLATIIFSGLGGAVLGLSTLSFYGRPQDKLINIAIGGAVGVMAGTVFVTYRAATNPQELFGQDIPMQKFEDEQRARFALQEPSATQIGLQFSF